MLIVVWLRGGAVEVDRHTIPPDCAVEVRDTSWRWCDPAGPPFHTYRYASTLVSARARRPETRATNSAGLEGSNMLRTIGTTQARYLGTKGERKPGCHTTALFEQAESRDAEGNPIGKGPFKIDLPTEICNELIEGGECTIEFKQKKQDLQHV